MQQVLVQTHAAFPCPWDQQVLVELQLFWQRDGQLFLISCEAEGARLLGHQEKQVLQCQRVGGTLLRNEWRGVAVNRKVPHDRDLESGGKEYKEANISFHKLHT